MMSEENKEKVILRYWLQETMESGSWIDLTMTRKQAEQCIKDSVFDQAEIV